MMRAVGIGFPCASSGTGEWIDFWYLWYVNRAMPDGSNPVRQVYPEVRSSGRELSQVETEVVHHPPSQTIEFGWMKG